MLTPSAQNLLVRPQGSQASANRLAAQQLSQSAFAQACAFCSPRPGSPITPFSPRAISTIAAARAGRTVAGVVAVRAYMRGEDPERKRSRQLQRGLETAVNSFSQGHGLRKRGLGTRAANCFRGHWRRLWCTRCGRHAWQSGGRTGLPCALSLAVFPHPRCSLCWITIRHS